MKKFALIGCGAVAEHHALNILRIGELVAVCDVAPERADAFAGKYSANAFYNVDDLMSGEKEIGAVVICTPTGYHAEHVIKSLQAKKHVVCESPLCLTTAAAWQIIETEKFCRRRVVVLNAAMQHPLLEKFKTMLSNGTVGEVYSFQLGCLLQVPEDYLSGWRGKQFPGGGLLYTTFSQSVDAIVQLFGEIADVKGFKQNAAHQQATETEDTGVVALQMKNGVLGTLHWSVNAVKGRQEISLTVVGENGIFHTSGENLMTWQHGEEKNPLYASEIGQLQEIPFHDYYSSNYLKGVYDQLLPVFDHQPTTLTGTFEALKTVETIEKIYKATSQS